MDLHLDRSFRVFRNNRYPYIDVRAPQPDLTELLSVEDDEPFILHPGEFVLGQTLEWVELPDDLVARLEGKSSLGRLGLLIHSTAGYVDPGWKGNLTLELSNVANLPIALYYGMRIGQISFFKMSSPVERPYGSPELGSRYQGQKEPTASAFHRDFDGKELTPVAHERRGRLAGGARRRDARSRSIQAGTFRSDAGALFGPVPRLLWDRLVTDEIDDEHRLLQALNCLLIETPVGRVLVETGIGERVDDKTRAMRGYEGPCDRARARGGRVPARDGRRRGDEPPPFRPCRRAAARRRRARLPARHDRRPEGRVGDRPGRQPAARGVVRPAGARARRGLGRAGLGRTASSELLPGVSVVPTGGHSAGHQAIVVRGTGDGARTLAFFGDLFMRPWGANPRWVTAFDDFPLDSVARKAELFAQAADEGWLIVLSHERRPADRAARRATATASASSRSRAARARTLSAPRLEHRLDQRLGALPRRPGRCTTWRMTPSRSMKNWVGSANTRYSRKTWPEPSKPIV